ncbi:MAG TPA: GTPase Era [Candidatus Binatia bacterium]|jgi:GTP-binding protein Era|nr:GTPase Era [Candidatus Binatia bacterium]
MDKPRKSGLVVLVGRSNVGKSTLLNSLIGTKIAIATPKPQTTRNVIQGVLHDARGQIVFVDTPGIFKQVPDQLTAKLNEKARDALEGVDVVLYVVDPARHVGDEEEAVHRMVKQLKIPKILVLNKADQKRPYIDEYMAWRDEFTAIVDVSALSNKGLKPLVDAVIEALPEGGVDLYPPDQITNVENKFWLEELIREKVFMGLHEEIPYSTTVRVDEVARREEGTVYIKASVLTTATRYKKMIIGAGASKIRGIGRAARKELELVTGDKIYLDLDVQVEERWQERFE